MYNSLDDSRLYHLEYHTHNKQTVYTKVCPFSCLYILFIPCMCTYIMLIKYDLHLYMLYCCLCQSGVLLGPYLQGEAARSGWDLGVLRVQEQSQFADQEQRISHSIQRVCCLSVQREGEVVDRYGSTSRGRPLLLSWGDGVPVSRVSWAEVVSAKVSACRQLWNPHYMCPN
jgi:hypothetical protein